MVVGDFRISGRDLAAIGFDFSAAGSEMISVSAKVAHMVLTSRSR